MSAYNSIGILLDIQDSNIKFEENCVKEGDFKGIACKYIVGKLTYNAPHCIKCGIKNENFIVYKNDTQTSRITLPITGVKRTYLC